ncbi:metacaspase-2-like [Prorops nasuta]|uniref:metacaspase-2-like n=1 Tax=Prorops nasuta TaxID=863751 RepID=UPI0034CE6CA0
MRTNNATLKDTYCVVQIIGSAYKVDIGEFITVLLKRLNLSYFIKVMKVFMCFKDMKNQSCIINFVQFLYKMAKKDYGIAEALLQLLPNINFEDFIKSEECRSWRKENCLWYRDEIKNEIYKLKHPNAIEGYGNSCVKGNKSTKNYINGNNNINEYDFNNNNDNNDKYCYEINSNEMEIDGTLDNDTFTDSETIYGKFIGNDDKEVSFIDNDIHNNDKCYYDDNILNEMEKVSEKIKNIDQFTDNETICEIYEQNNNNYLYSNKNDVIHTNNYKCSPNKIKYIKEENTLAIKNKILHSTFIIPAKFWENYLIRVNDHMRLKRGWTQEFNAIFEVTYPYCILSFLWHKCYEHKRKRAFTAKAICKSSLCNVEFEFTTLQPINENNNVTILTFTSKEVDHKIGEDHRRFICGEKRKKIREELKGKDPSTYILEKLIKVPDDVLKHGNLNNTPSLQLIQKISSEINRRYDLDRDEIIALIELKEKLIPQWKGLRIAGYIQEISLCPIRIILFSECVIKYLIYMRNPIFCYLDATGSIILHPGSKRYGPLPIAECITDSHDILSLTHFLNSFHHSMRCISSQKVIINKIETDFSFALIQSGINAFNKINLNRYLILSYEAIIHEQIETFCNNYTIFHICSTHFLKTVIRKIKSITKSKDLQILAGRAITKLIHCDDLETAAIIFANIVKVFGKKFVQHKKQCNIRNINFLQKVNKTGNTQHTKFLKKTFDDYNVNKWKDVVKFSPFHNFFKNTYNNHVACKNKKRHNFKKDNKKCNKKEVINRTERSIRFKKIYRKNSFLIKNPFFCDRFLKYLLSKILPYFPLWSAIIIKIFKIRRDSNAAVENWFKIVKNNIFKKKLKLSIVHFIEEMSTVIAGSLKHRRYELITERQKRNNKLRNSGPEMVKEHWVDKISRKYGKSKKNIFFTENKIITEDEINTHQHDTDADSDLIGEVSDKCFISNVLQKDSTQIVDENSNELMRETDNQINSIKDVKPWQDVKEYPSIVKGVNLHICNMIIDEISLESLKPNGCIEDNIINAFLSIIQIKSNNTEVLIFDTHFYEWVCNPNAISIGFLKWGTVRKAWSYQVWLIPIFNNHHWTLLEVDFNNKYYVYFDSLHGTVPKNLILNVSSYIEKLFARKDIQFSWKEWTLCVPNDILNQGRTLNCGIHLMLWAYIIISEENLYFENHEMDNIRRWICKTLFENDGIKINNNGKCKIPLDFPPDRFISKSEVDQMISYKYIPSPNLHDCRLNTMYYCANLTKSIKNRYIL